MKTLRSLFFINLFLFIMIFAACGGSGGTGTQSKSSDSTGSVAVFLADGPADAYEAINIWIKEVSLIPPEESARESIIIYESQDPNGYKINLLDYVDNDFLSSLFVTSR